MCIHTYNRRNSRNVILAVLWLAEEMPPMSTYLHPVVEMLLELESTGKIIMLLFVYVSIYYRVYSAAS